MINQVETSDGLVVPTDSAASLLLRSRREGIDVSHEASIERRFYEARPSAFNDLSGEDRCTGVDEDLQRGCNKLMDGGRRTEG